MENLKQQLNTANLTSIRQLAKLKSEQKEREQILCNIMLERSGQMDENNTDLTDLTVETVLTMVSFVSKN